MAYSYSVERCGAIVLVSFPHQLLHALSAIRYHRIRTGIPETARVTIVVWAFEPKQHARHSPFRDIITSITKSMPNVTALFPGRWERRCRLGPCRRFADRVAWFSQRLSHDDDIGFVFYSHDASADRTSQALMQALPGTVAICYGDPPGFICPSLDHVYEWTLPRSLVFGSMRRELLERRGAALNIVTIDMNPTPHKPATPQHTVPIEVVKRVLEELRHCLKQKMEIARLINNARNGQCPSYTLLMSNFSRSQLTSVPKEIDLYADACYELVPPGARVLLKPHYGGHRRLVSRLRKRLRAYNVDEFSSEGIALPIEMLPELVESTHVISFSAASLLVACLFRTTLTHALTATNISRYFPPEQVPYMVRTNNVIESQLVSIKSMRQQACHD